VGRGTVGSGGTCSHGVMSAGDNMGAGAVASAYEGGASTETVAGARLVAAAVYDSPSSRVTVKWDGVITSVRGCGITA
jgi:hypothetical protein